MVWLPGSHICSITRDHRHCGEDRSFNFTKQALLNEIKTIKALNTEQILMRKAVIQDRMVLDILTAAQGGTCAIIKIKCCVYIPDISGNVTAVLNDMRNQVRAMSNDNLPFWTSVLSWIKGDWWKNVILIKVIILLLLIFVPCIFNCVTQLVASRLGARFQVHTPRVQYLPMTDAH